MSLNIVPELGAKGEYRLGAPFDKALMVQTPYVCAAVRSLEDFIANGEDPFESFYVTNGLTEEDYDRDLVSGVSIVSLQSEGGEWVYVPSSYILSYPGYNGIRYTAVVIGVSIGAVPDTLDLSGLTSQVKDLVYHTIGTEAEIKTVVVSQPALVERSDHEKLELIRKAKITIYKSKDAEIAELRTQVDSLAGKLKTVEQLLIKKM